MAENMVVNGEQGKQFCCLQFPHIYNEGHYFLGNISEKQDTHLKKRDILPPWGDKSSEMGATL